MGAHDDVDFLACDRLLLIWETASNALLVAAGPQIPGEPEKVRKLATFSLSRARPRLQKSVPVGRNEGLAAIADRFFNAIGGRPRPP
jgi:hypothetical protein